MLNSDSKLMFSLVKVGSGRKSFLQGLYKLLFKESFNYVSSDIAAKSSLL